jgi:hypothetical protein
MPDQPASGTQGAAPAASPGSEAPAPAAPANWRESLPEEYRENPAIKTIADIPTLTKGYIEAQSRLGNSVRIPSREAGPEDRKAFRDRVLAFGKDFGITAIPGEGEDAAAFHAALGRPDKPEGYELPVYDDPDGDVDMSDADALRPVAHQLGISKAQFKGLVKAATDANMATQREQMMRQKADQDGLKKEWGAAYTLRMTQLKNFLDINGAPPNLKAAIETGGIDSHSAKWIYNIMETIGGESAEVSGQGKGGNSTTLTPTEALDRVAEIEKRMQNMAQGTDEYTQLLGRRMDLLRLAHPQ